MAANDIEFCRLLLTFALNLDPDQDGQNVGPDLGQIFLTLCRKLIFKKPTDDENMQNYSIM